MEEVNEGATTEIETPEVVERSIDDTIRDTLRDIESRGVAEESDEPVINATKKVASVTDDAQKVTKSVTKRSVEASVEPSAESAAKQTSEDTSVVKSALKQAPNTWKKEAQEAFLKADPVLQAEIQRREADIHKGIEQYKQAAEWAKGIDSVLSPYKQTFEQLGVTPEAAIGELLAADRKLRTGSLEEKTAYFAYLAQSYGIDLGHAVESSQQFDPRMYQLQEQNQRLQQTLQSQQHQVQQREYDELNSHINSFIADPAHSHFEEVRGHVVALLQAGQAQTLEDAYEQAIYANPVTRAAVLQQHAAEAKAESAKKAQAARAASVVNMRSRPAIATTQPIGTMDETIRNKLRELTSGI